MQARRTGRARELLWLPAIFALWANMHIQFIDGLLVLGLAWVETLAARWGVPSVCTRMRPKGMGLALAGSLLATLAESVWLAHLPAAYELATQAGALNKVSELQAFPSATCRTSLSCCWRLGSAAALAWQRRFPLVRDGAAAICRGAVVPVAARCVGDGCGWQLRFWRLRSQAARRLRSGCRSGGATIAVLAAGLAMTAGFRMMRVNNARLATDLAKDMPVKAVEAVRAKGYAGPLYNDINWGGYLIWNLRMPVSLDGRAAFYGDQAIDRSVSTWNAEPDWASDLQLKSASLVIGRVKAPLTQMLRMDSHYKLAYEDKVAAVFVAHK